MENQPAPRQADVVSEEYREVRITAEGWSGPLPSPDALERIEGLSPGSTERFLTVFESQISHRQTLGTRESKRMDWGLAAAFVVVTTIIGAGAFLIYTGHDWAGAGMIGASIVRLAAVFISG